MKRGKLRSALADVQEHALRGSGQKIRGLGERSRDPAEAIYAVLAQQQSFRQLPASRVGLQVDYRGEWGFVISTP